MTPTFPSSALLNRMFYAPGRPQGSVWTGKLPDWGQDHVLPGEGHQSATGQTDRCSQADLPGTKRRSRSALGRGKCCACAAETPPPSPGKSFMGGGRAPAPAAERSSSEARPRTRAPWPLGLQTLKRFPHPPHPPRETASPSGRRSAAFCPVPEKRWRKGREGQRGRRRRGGRGEATSIPSAKARLRSRPRQSPGLTLAMVTLTAAPLGTRFQTAPGLAQSAFASLLLQHALREAGRRMPTISQMEKLRLKRAKCLG